MSGFEGALNHHWCHLTKDYAPLSPTLCGAPPNGILPHAGSDLGDYCDGCGRPKCPDCEFTAWEKGR